MRHRQACAGEHRGEAAGAHHARDLEQLIGVVGAARAGGEHEVVARALALGAHVPRRHPRQRIEPVQRARDLRDHVRQAVAALHVRELVQQHDAQPLGRPVCRRPPASARPAGRCPTPSASPRARCAGRRCAARRRARAASARACGSHGASVTRSVRRDIHCTAMTPAAGARGSASAPIIHTISSSAGPGDRRARRRCRVQLRVATDCGQSRWRSLAAGVADVRRASGSSELRAGADGSWKLGAGSVAS